MSNEQPSNIVSTNNEAKKPLIYPRDFFDAQVDFAKKVSQISGIPLGEALLRYTGLYSRFNLGRIPDGNNPIWQEFASSVDEKNLSEKTYEFYLKRKDFLPEKKDQKAFGCFKFEYRPEEKCILIHFGNRGETGSPLSDENFPNRINELKTMFGYIKNNHPEAKIVRGESWLYNLEKYCRLFPPEYTKDTKINLSRFTGFSTWGQLFDKDMAIKPDVLKVFRERLASAKSMDDISHSFPKPALNVETDIDNFYKFYGI